MKKIPLIVVLGATASGKTAMSIKIAKKFNGEIVSADSMQIYKDMNIGTAKPDDEEKDGINHHLMDFIEPDKEYSVADYVNDAHITIENIIKRGKLPILVGGTGLYIDSLTKDIPFEEERKDDAVREELTRFAEENGSDALFEVLKKIDSESAEIINPNNVKRVIRAIEFYKLTGKKISQHNLETKEKESRYNPLFIGISWNRELLYERIDKRVDIMFQNGLLEEVLDFYNKGYTKRYQSMQGIGYKQLLDYFRGLSTIDEAKSIIKRDSRRYAKRQLTWFRRNKKINWINAGDNVISEANELVSDFLNENRENFINM